MKKLRILLSIVLVAVLVAVTYHYFESAVRHSIDYIWDTWLDTENERLLVIPVCFVISLVFFGLQHYLDPESETHEAEGLGETPAPTLVNLAKVLLIGFFSLVAGASLGPEAILVPACLIIGGYIGNKLFKREKQIISALTMTGFVALFAAFFNSFFAGMLGLLLVTKQVKVKVTPAMIVVAAIASGVTVLTLKLLDSAAYTRLPAAKWDISPLTVTTVIVLLFAGYATTYMLGAVHQIFERVQEAVIRQQWFVRGMVAAAGLSVLYIFGGTLVEFTGNQSVVPMLHQAANLGVIGLSWIFLVKVLAIVWSKTLGYRGGLVFPSVFVAAVLVAIAQQAVTELSFTIGLLAVMVGIMIANARLKILF
jgi:H+/Cl- antiporter ClcA